jgi:hypothetical protein
MLGVLTEGMVRMIVFGHIANPYFLSSIRVNHFAISSDH